MATFLLKFENLVRKLKLAGAYLDENDVLTQLFPALPERYDLLVNALQIWMISNYLYQWKKDDSLLRRRRRNIEFHKRICRKCQLFKVGKSSSLMANASNVEKVDIGPKTVVEPTMKDILYILVLRDDLLSVRKLTKAVAVVKFSGN